MKSIKTAACALAAVLLAATPVAATAFQASQGTDAGTEEGRAAKNGTTWVYALGAGLLVAVIAVVAGSGGEDPNSP